LQHRLLWPEDRPWPVIAHGGEVLLPDVAAAGLRPGETIVTGKDGWARVRVARIGEVDLGPGSRLRLEETRSGRHQVRLIEGRLRARVWAPPLQFGVAVPGGEIRDLGCEFSVDSDADGRGLLRVYSGWVMLERDGVEVLVPQGTQVALRDGLAVGTPHASDVSHEFTVLLAVLDAKSAPWRIDDPRLARLAELARPADAISLLSLLQRHPVLADSPLFERLLAVLPAAAPLSRDGLRRGDPAALERAWEALPYPRVKAWWLQWRDVFAWAPDESKAPPR
jgi:hypothetical protein